jgi:N-acetylglucosaminyl-diphospho-decaprenol L-rhamnosyltransferase
MTRHSTVSAIVVSYNVLELLLECVASLVAAQVDGELVEIIVVDSASSDGSAAAVRERFPSVMVIEAPNRGYGAGANRGIAASNGDYVFVLNADTVMPAGAILALSAWLDAHPTTAVVGPRLRHPDGSVQPSRRRFPTRWTPLFESTILQEWWPDNPWVRRYYLADTSGDIAHELDWLVGAALLVRREAIERVGGFDEAFRMYAEEVEWCWRFRRHGWKVAYVSDADVIHHEGASTNQDVPRRQLDFDRSRVLLMERMYGRRDARVIRAALLGNYGLHLARECAKWMLGHRRELRRQRVRFYVGVLRSGLREAESSS